MSDEHEFDFDGIFAKSRDEVPPVIDCPTGIWRLGIISAGKFEPQGDNSGGIMVIFRPIEPGADVDPSLVEAADGVENLDRIFARFFVDGNRALNRVWDFMEKTGAEVSGRNLTEVLNAIKGYEVYAKVDHKPRKGEDGGVFVNVSDFAEVG